MMMCRQVRARGVVPVAEFDRQEAGLAAEFPGSAGEGRASGGRQCLLLRYLQAQGNYSLMIMTEISSHMFSPLWRE